LDRPATAALHAPEIRKLHRAGVSKSEIARRLRIGRTSVRRILNWPISGIRLPPVGSLVVASGGLPDHPTEPADRPWFWRACC